MPHHIFGVIVLGSLVLGSTTALSQTFPKPMPIRIFTLLPGGSANFAARMLADGISPALGQPVVVESRPTAIIGAEIVSKAPADGHTLLVGASSFLVGSLLQSLPYDPVKDFVPVTMIMKEVYFLVAHPALPVRNVKELIALAKSKPGELNYSSAGTGGASHLAVELFKAMAGVNIQRVPYKTGNVEIPDLLAGQVQLTINSASGVLQHVKSGRLRGLAVTGSRPSPMAPELPTLGATVPGYEAEFLTGFYALSTTPPAITSRLNQDAVRYLSQTDVKEKFLAIGTEIVASSPEQSSTIVQTNMNKWRKVVKDSNIKAD